MTSVLDKCDRICYQACGSGIKASSDSLSQGEKEGIDLDVDDLDWNDLNY
jgi:hypothetical protein